MAIVVAAFIASSCTVVTINGADGVVRLERHFGVVNIHLPPAATSVTADVKTLGYYTTPLGGGLGVAAARFAAMSPACGLILWIESDAHMSAATRLAERSPHICVVQPQREGTSP